MRSWDILLAGGFTPGCRVGEVWEEGEVERNAAVMAEEEGKFCGASALRRKAQQICPGEGKY